MDGRKSFIFSWNKKHRAIHEEAMLHFLDPGKKEKKFEPKLQLTKPAVDTNRVRWFNRRQSKDKLLFYTLSRTV